jgi:hypothetical protein
MYQDNTADREKFVLIFCNQQGHDWMLSIR